MSCVRANPEQQQSKRRRCCEREKVAQELTVGLCGKREQSKQQQRTPAPEAERETAPQPVSLRWHGRVCCSSPLLSSLLLSSLQYSPHDRLLHAHTASPSECVYECAREVGGGGGGGVPGMQAPGYVCVCVCVCVCVLVHRNVRKSTPHKTHQQWQQQLQLIVLQPGLTVAAQLRERWEGEMREKERERVGERGKRGEFTSIGK